MFTIFSKRLVVLLFLTVCSAITCVRVHVSTVTVLCPQLVDTETNEVGLQKSTKNVRH